MTGPLPPGRPPGGSVPLWSRLLGLGSIFGKTTWDLRAWALAIGVSGGLLMILGGYFMADQFATPASRLQLKIISTSLPPVMAGLLGDPINVDRLGGMLSWRIGSTLPVLFSIWSILALSGTLAGEAGLGSLDVVLSTPVSRRSLALQKVAAFGVALSGGMLVAALLTWLSGQAFAVLPGDEIPAGAALGQFALYGVEILLPGALAFALGTVLTRGAAAGLAGGVTVAAYLVDGFSSVVPFFDRLEAVSWFTFTAGHRPLAGSWDWSSVLVLLAVAVLLLAVGVWRFERGDVASPVRLPIPGLPDRLLGVTGPFTRSFGDRLPAALAWGVGTGLTGIVFAMAGTSFAEAMAAIPAFGRLLDLISPGVDYTRPGGFLQVAIFSAGVVMFGLAAATAVSGWASDEEAGRLDTVLAAPLGRAAWSLRSGLGAMAAAPVVGLLMAGATALGTVQAGGDAWTPIAGTVPLVLYMTAMTGVGIAIGGLVRPGAAGPAVIVLVVSFYLVELIGGALRLPDWLMGLSLNHHLGHPMIGSFDPIGIALSVALSVGGPLLGAWGLSRRDLRG